MLHSWSDIRKHFSFERREKLDAEIKATIATMRDPLKNPKPGDIWKVRNQFLMVDFVDEEDNSLGYVSSDNVISEWHTIPEFAHAMQATHAQLELYAEDTQLRNVNEKTAVASLQSLVCTGRI